MNLEDLRKRVNAVGPVWLYYPDEYELLFRYASMSQGRIVEIGVAFGGSACLLVLGSNQNVQVASIDPFSEKVDGYVIEPDSVSDKVRNVIGFQDNRWDLWAMTSAKAAQKYKGRDLGLLFVDGDHTYEGCKQDVDLWLPKLMIGGYMLLHDSRRIDDMPADVYSRGWRGPTKVGVWLMKNKLVKLVEEAYSTMVFQRVH